MALSSCTAHGAKAYSLLTNSALPELSVFQKIDQSVRAKAVLPSRRGQSSPREMELVQAKEPSERAAAHPVAFKRLATEACEASLVVLGAPTDSERRVVLRVFLATYAVTCCHRLPYLSGKLWTPS